ncbi:MAG: hypothetical protein ABW252_07150 [Polyangiales bacterium]
MAMTMQRHGRLLLGVHNAIAPTDTEWDAWLALASERAGQDLRTIVEVYGAVGPSARQRNAMTLVLGGLDPRTAVMSDSMLVRGVVTAVKWSGIPIAAFSPGKYHAAGRYLELTPDELSLARSELETLRQAAGVHSVPRARSHLPSTPS